MDSILSIEAVMKHLIGIQILPYGMKHLITQITVQQVIVRYAMVLINVTGVAYFVKVGNIKTPQAKMSVGCAIEVLL